MCASQAAGPDDRFGHAACVVRDDSGVPHLYVIGGFNHSYNFGDIHKLNLRQFITITHAVATCLSVGKVGGGSHTVCCLFSTADTRHWTQVSSTTVSECMEYGAYLTAVAAGPYVVMFGGCYCAGGKDRDCYNADLQLTVAIGSVCRP